jgi:hypothetical protein
LSRNNPKPPSKAEKNRIVSRLRGSLSKKTFERIAALKTFLSADKPISKRAAMYMLLSMPSSDGSPLLASTKDFVQFNAVMNQQLQDGTLCDDNFDDDCFVDNRRRTDQAATWTNWIEFQQACRDQYRRDYWQDQPTHVEVWLEKDTAAFLVQHISRYFGVPLRVSSGYYSRSFLNGIAREWSSVIKPIQVFYIGDFDPSGLDLERAAQWGENKKWGIADFLTKKYGWTPSRFSSQVDWRRLGVTHEDYQSIPTSARVTLKPSDPRVPAFQELYSKYGVEIEALEVLQKGLLATRLQQAISNRIDADLWAESEQQEQKERKAA